MRRVLSLLLIALAPLLASPKMVAGDGKANRLRMIFLAEGYTALQEADFERDVARINNGFKSKLFYNIYSNAINVFSSFKASEESGADDPLNEIYVNTAFDATFNTNGIDRLLTVSTKKVNTFLNTEYLNYDPSLDIVIVVVNSTKYGGSGGQIAVTSVESSAPEVAIHEVGHSFAKLADEYDTNYEGWVRVEERNATAKTTRSEIVWNNWIDDSTPLPTPKTAPYLEGVVGLFEGANYSSTGWYRPSYSCEMRSLGKEFCSVCTESHVVELYKQVALVDSLYPSPSTFVFLSQTEALTLYTLPIDQPIEVVWRIDQREVGRGDSLNLAEALAGFEVGARVTLIATARDTTGLVKNSLYLSQLQEEVEWRVVVDQTTSIHSKPPLHTGELRVVQSGNTLFVTLPAEVRVIELYSVTGQQIGYWRSESSTVEISTESLPRGSYLLRAGQESRVVQKR